MFLIYSSLVIGQSFNSNKINDSQAGEYELSRNQFNELINLQFSKLVSGKSEGGVGNFASADIINSVVTLSSSFQMSNGSILNLTFHGGATDGLASIFTNSRINSNISFHGKYHFLNPNKKRKVRYVNTTSEKRLESQKIYTKYQELLIEEELWASNLELKILKKKKEIVDLKIKIKDLHKTIRDSKISSSDKKSKEYEIEISGVKILQLSKEIEDLTELCDFIKNGLHSDSNQFVLKQKRAGELGALKETFKIKDITYIELGWFSIGYEVENNSFTQFNKEKEITEQLKKVSSTTQSISFSYNQYAYRESRFCGSKNDQNLKENKKCISSTPTLGSYFFKFGLSIGLSDSFDSLDKVSIKDTQILSGFENSSREISNDFIAYQGSFDKKLLNISLFGDTYLWFWNSSRAALHLFSNFNASQKLKPKLDAGLGILLNIKNKEKEKPAVNVELFYSFIDLFDNRQVLRDDTLFERNVVGLRFTVPINFIKKN